MVESRLETYERSGIETRLASTVFVFSTAMWWLAHTLPTLSTPANTRPPNDEAAGSPCSSTTPGWVNAAFWPSPRGASVRWGKVESPRLCRWGRAKWVRWEGTLLGDGSGAPAPPPSIKGAMQLTRRDITATEARPAGRCASVWTLQPWWSRAGCQGHFHTPEVMQSGITPRGSVATWLVLRLRDLEEQLCADTEESLGFFCLCGDNPLLLDKDPTSCTQTDPAAFSPDKWLYLKYPAMAPSHTSLYLWPNG